jgi:FdhD protein
MVEDLGRHNCVDKLTGLFLLQNRPFTPNLLLLSGRISSEMVFKTFALGIPLIVSRTSPTALAIDTAWEGWNNPDRIPARCAVRGLQPPGTPAGIETFLT